MMVRKRRKRRPCYVSVITMSVMDNMHGSKDLYIENVVMQKGDVHYMRCIWAPPCAGANMMTESGLF